MLSASPASRMRISVQRLAAIPRERLDDILLERGISPESLEDILQLLSSRDVVASPEDVLDDAFRPRYTYETPFPQSRFSDGTFGVYYSALEIRTCKKEVSFHIGFPGPRDVSRVYSLITCWYEGLSVDLRGMEKDHPELISEDESGYPYCRALGKSAVELARDAFLTVSARAAGGMCVPVFNRASLSSPDATGIYRATISDAGVTFQQL